MSTFTDSQQQAIRARGNVLVSAGAGTGKTRTLVERCLRLIVEEGCSLENILMVTFTEAAAAEMRQRLRKELERKREDINSSDSATVSLPLPSTGRGIEGEGWDGPQLLEDSHTASLSPLTLALPMNPEGRFSNRPDSAAGKPPLQFKGAPRDLNRGNLSRLRGEGEAHPAGDIEMVCGLHERLHWLEEQLALLDTAPISTLHSFCLRLVREHFYELHVDPQVTVLDESQTQPLIHDTFDALFDRCYRGELPFAGGVRELVRSYGGGSDYKIRALVLKLHRYTQSLPPSRRWLESEIASLQNAEPVKWRELLVEAFGEWRAEWLPELREYAASENVTDCIRALEACLARPTLDEVASALECVRVADSADWSGKKGRFREPIKRFFDGAAFLAPLTESRDDRDPLAEDWTWCREPMLALLELTREFTARFTAAKRAQGGVDFADLEQLALALLLDADGQPTRIAADWQRKFSHLFVDEYQDINAAQDAIIRAVSRDVGAGCPQPAAFSHGTRRAEDSAPYLGNRFLVGDVKQSIYRFRLADPTIFRNYEQRWRDGGGQRILLSDNFRSRERILDFINPLFAALMRSSIGGVSFEPDAQLRFGAPAERAPLSAAANAAPRVELHVITKASADDIEPVEEDAEEIIVTNGSPAAKSPVEDLLAVEKEARLIALRLRELRESGHEIWNELEKQMQPVDWKDMVVLLRSPGPRVESFAKEFSRAGVPLSAARAGFYSAIEIQDLLNLLKLLDNPLQDIPLIAVLRSPLVGLSLDELATVRILGGDSSFFAAINRVHFKGSDADGIATANVRAKLRTFLANYERWRQLVRQTSVSQCLETVLAETHYEALLLARSRGRERVANVRRLLELARQYDPYQRQGLYRFLRFVAEQEDAGLDQDAARVETENAVRLMSIHQSKGLEFPVVALGCLGAQFNFQDLREDILLNAELGLCPKIIAPESGQPYPSLPLWMAKRREQRELLGEEMRLLYVAMTRARDTLVLSALDNNRSGGRWVSGRIAPFSDRELISARNYFTWLKLWLSMATTPADWKSESEGECPLLRWKFYREDERVGSLQPQVGARPELPVANRQHVGSPPVLNVDALRQRLAWHYKDRAVTTEPAKTNVSVLRRRLAEEDDEARQFFRSTSRTEPKRNGLSAAEIGVAHHTFLQRVAFDRVASLIDLRNEAERLLKMEHLTADEAAVLNFEALLAFWHSPVGRAVCANASCAHRELPFTARFSPSELRAAGLPDARTGEEEFVIVQGIVDLAVILPEEIRIIDFKTDHIKRGELPEATEKYRAQLALYASALNRIYGQPVTERWLHFLSLGETIPV